MLAVPWGKTSSGLHLLYFPFSWCSSGTPISSLWRDPAKGFHPALPIGISLWWYNCPYVRHIIYKKEKEAINKLIFPSACLPHLWEIASSQWGEREWHLPEQTPRSHSQLMRKIPCPHTTRCFSLLYPKCHVGWEKDLCGCWHHKLLIRGGIPSSTISFWDNKPNQMFLVLCTAWTS